MNPRWELCQVKKSQSQKVTYSLIFIYFLNISSIQFSPSVGPDSLRPHGLQHIRLPWPSPTPGACSNSGPSSQWCHPTISFSVIHFFPCLQSFLVSKVKSLSRVRLFVTPWTVAYQAPLSMGFSRQEYWSGLPFPSPWNLPDPGIEPGSPALQTDALLSEPPGKSSFFKNFSYLLMRILAHNLLCDAYASFSF